MPYILPDFTEGTDAAASTSTSYTLSVGQTAQGTISSNSDHDWYRVTLTAGQTYTFAQIGTGTNGLRDTFLNLRDANGNVLVSDDDSGPASSSSLTYTATSTGTYYIDAGSWNNASSGQYGISVSLGTHANFNISMTGGAIDAYTNWNTRGTPLTITYGFRQSAAGYTVTGSNISTFTQCTATEMAAVQSILQLWSEVCGITFQQVNPGGYTNNATILIGNYSDAGDGAGAFAFYPGSTASSASAGDLWLNLAGGINPNSISFGTYTWQAIMHELGHALGLSHPGDYNAAPGVQITYANDAQFVQDSGQYTVMSYFGGSATGESPGFFGSAETPMLGDIYEMQQLYGANNTTRTGNTTYGFGTNAGQALYNFTIGHVPNFCIWDAGGTDTLDCSNFSAAQLINLNQGTFSNVGGGVGNISIALGVTVENAVGGSGGDTIIGNSANNVLIGRNGNDTISGGLGYDTSVFSGNRSSYTVTRNGLITTVVGPEGTDTLTSVELLQFANSTMPIAPARGDFGGDGTSDILWRYAPTGTVYEFQVNHLQPTNATLFGGDANWSIVGTGDFNGDGNADALWRYGPTGQIFENLMSGSSVTSTTGLGGDTNWTIAGIGDFNGDGNSDILWRHTPTGQVFEFQMNGGTATNVAGIGGSTTSTIVGIGDFDGDGKTDILWRDNATGAITENLMNGSTVLSSASLGGDLNWAIAGTGDFNGDGRTDILWNHIPSGSVFEFLMNGSSTLAVTALGGDANWSVAGTGDFTGDGKTDILWRYAPTGQVYGNEMNGSSVVSSSALGGDANWRPLVV